MFCFRFVLVYLSLFIVSFGSAIINNAGDISTYLKNGEKLPPELVTRGVFLTPTLLLSYDFTKTSNTFLSNVCLQDICGFIPIKLSEKYELSLYIFRKPVKNIRGIKRYRGKIDSENEFFLGSPPGNVVYPNNSLLFRPKVPVELLDVVGDKSDFGAPVFIEKKTGRNTVEFLLTGIVLADGNQPAVLEFDEKVNGAIDTAIANSLLIQKKEIRCLNSGVPIAPDWVIAYTNDKDITHWRSKKGQGYKVAQSFVLKSKKNYVLLKLAEPIRVDTYSVRSRIPYGKLKNKLKYVGLKEHNSLVKLGKNPKISMLEKSWIGSGIFTKNLNLHSSKATNRFMMTLKEYCDGFYESDWKFSFLGDVGIEYLMHTFNVKDSDRQFFKKELPELEKLEDQIQKYARQFNSPKYLLSSQAIASMEKYKKLLDSYDKKTKHLEKNILNYGQFEGVNVLYFNKEAFSNIESLKLFLDQTKQVKLSQFVSNQAYKQQCITKETKLFNSKNWKEFNLNAKDYLTYARALAMNNSLDPLRFRGINQALILVGKQYAATLGSENINEYCTTIYKCLFIKDVRKKCKNVYTDKVFSHNLLNYMMARGLKPLDEFARINKLKEQEYILEKYKMLNTIYVSKKRMLQAKCSYSPMGELIGIITPEIKKMSDICFGKELNTEIDLIIAKSILN